VSPTKAVSEPKPSTFAKDLAVEAGVLGPLWRIELAAWASMRSARIARPIEPTT
jgi:hypothetical protein